MPGTLLLWAVYLAALAWSHREDSVSDGKEPRELVSSEGE